MVVCFLPLLSVRGDGHSHEGPHRFWMSRIVDSRKAQIKIILTLAIVYSGGAGA